MFNIIIFSLYAVIHLNTCTLWSVGAYFLSKLHNLCEFLCFIYLYIYRIDWVWVVGMQKTVLDAVAALVVFELASGIPAWEG